MDNNNTSPNEPARPDPERLTFCSTPPDVRNTQRRAFWPAALAEARECPGEWVRIARWFSPSTAAQVASDIRNSHRRKPDKMRVAGLLPGDRWDTRWGLDPADRDEEHAYVWLRFAPQIATSSASVIVNW